jgi:hypothetical protein
MNFCKKASRDLKSLFPDLVCENNPARKQIKIRTMTVTILTNASSLSESAPKASLKGTDIALVIFSALPSMAVAKTTGVKKKIPPIIVFCIKRFMGLANDSSEFH